MKDIKISIIGFGDVGQGVAQVLSQKQQTLEKIGVNIKVVAIADSSSSLVNADGIDLEKAVKVKRTTGIVGRRGSTTAEIIKNTDHDLVVEVTPTDINTGEPGLTNILTAIESGKHVVTSNKGPFARNYAKLMKAAKDHGVVLRYEATVGGAMPIINLIEENLAGNTIERIDGILNGTCNYILTRMGEETLDYQHALLEAQELGIAEADPTYDVMGIDAACKLVILANTAYNNNATFDDVSITGITKITPQALELADKNGYAVRLICEVSEQVLSVAPKLVPKKHPLAVGGTLNIATIHTDLSKMVTISGIGAGSIETASAILSDIIHIYRACLANTR
ncbi:MAG: Homoserine dehydrogenase [Candidatus Argoarchaeum ethanivorans]|uniref:Homoserine dehydrogenase n=1 Tax=Candidatus Argoarchaeum ethanivorans TaxID=2608793 RepID=A0A811T6I6_9EURY|nr:MAG: Homoserine dehydrogenase [Candidatus Argoarchaeum ethanivorans]